VERGPGSVTHSPKTSSLFGLLQRRPFPPVALTDALYMVIYSCQILQQSVYTRAVSAVYMGTVRPDMNVNINSFN